MVKMQCPEGMTSVCWNGTVYEANQDGVVEVPHAAMLDLQAHGLTEYQDQPKKKKGSAE